MRVEAKVGLFVVMGFLFLIGLSTQLSIVRNIGSTGYKVYVNIKDTSGLNTHAKVEMNGVDAGEVLAINFDGNEVKLTLFLNDGIKVPKNSTVSLQQESLLGGKMINIEAGDGEAFLEPEQVIAKSSTLASFEQTSQKIYDAADEFTKLMNAANNVLDEERQVKLKSTIDDLSVAMKNIKDIVADNKSLINETIKKYKLLAEEFILTGKSALVKIDRYLASITESELQISIHSQYMLSDAYNKVFFTLSYLPELGTYYILKIVTGDDYSEKDGSGNLIAPTLHDSGFLRFTAQYEKCFKCLLARAGLQESTGDIGIDYFMNNDSLQWTLDIFDFNTEHDLRSKSAHLNFGLGMQFVDDHLKYFISGTGAPS